ncbi:MAG: hypothetical protein IKQ94_07220 [Bacteroidales bacterium]|nr:hypothetical protein [Bacteroidales bacterium]
MTETRTDKICFVLLQAIAVAQIVAGVVFIIFSYGYVATTVLCTVTFFGVFASGYRKDVAAAILFASSTAWLLQMFDAFTYFILFQCFIADMLVYPGCMSVLSLTNLFLADFIWTTSNGKPFKPKRLCLIIVLFALLPVLSYIYRSHDIKSASYRIEYLTDIKQKPSIVFTIGEERTPRIAIDNKDVVFAIINNSDHDTTGWYCDNCRIRVRTCFTDVKKIELVKNLSNNIFYDDLAELSITDNGHYKAVAMKIEDLWW